MTPLDGNSLAGTLRELFAVDTTTAMTRCSGCGQASAVGALTVYAHAPGVVARCPSCDDVILRVVRGPDRAWLDLRGTVSLEVPLPA